MEAVTKKEIGIDVFLLAFSALLFWLLLSTDIIVNNPIVLMLLILAVPLWLSCLAIALTLVSNYSAALLIILIPIILVGLGMLRIEIVAAAVLITALLVSARFIFVRELKSRIEIKTHYVFYSGTKLLVLAFIIVITGISMPYITQSIMADEAVIPESTVKLLLKPYEPFIAKSMPGGSLDVSIDQVVEQQMQQQYPGNPEEAARQKDIVGKQLTEQLSNQFEQDISPSQDISSIVTSVLNKQIYSLTSKYPIMTPIAIFVLVVLVSRLVVPIISIFLLFVIASLVSLARKAKLINLLSVSKSVEYLEL